MNTQRGLLAARRHLVVALMAVVAALFVPGLTSAEPAAPVLGIAPGSGTGYGQTFLPGSVLDHGAPPVNLTTPYAARRLGALIAGLDAPVGGRPLGSPVYVVEAAPGRSGSVEASPTGAVLIYRKYLEAMSGVKIDPAQPRTVDAAVAATLDHGQRSRSLASIIAHELGHLTQGHGRFAPGTEYAAAAAQQSEYLMARLNGPLFSVKLQDAMREYRRTETAAGRPSPDAPSTSSHVYEYLADQHAVTATYMKDGNLRGAMDFWNRVSPGPGRGPGVQYSHPTRTARILNAVSFVEANPQLFASGLQAPLSFRVARDLPPITLTRSGDRITVTGREAVAARLAPPERLVYDRFQDGRAAYYRKAASPLARLLYPKDVRAQRLEPAVADAFAEPGTRVSGPSGLGRAGASLHADVARGAIFVGPALAVLSGVVDRMAAGDSVQDSVRGTAAALDPALLATDAAAGTLGAAAGSLLPVPAQVAGLRLVGGIARAAPALAGAMVAARLATQAVVLHREGRLDAQALFGSIDWTKLVAQTLGAAAGMSLAGAAVSAGFLPALALGPVALVPLAAGIAGGYLAEKLVDWWRSRDTPARASAAPRVDPGAFAGTGPRALAGAPAPAEDDPFGDLRRATR